MKRIIIMLALAALTVVAMSFSAALAFAAPSPCTAGEPGCTSKKQTTTNSPSQGGGGGGGAEPFNLTTEKSGKGNGTQPEQNPHTVVLPPTCTNHSGNHTFSDTSKCTR